MGIWINAKYFCEGDHFFARRESTILSIMDFLLAEIDRKRRQIESNEVTSNKKYFKRGELAAKQAEDYRKKQEEKLRKRGLLDDNESGPSTRERDFQSDIAKALGKGKKELDGDKKDKKLPHDEVIKRLREKGEPIKLFGENNDETAQRLRYVEMMAKEDEKGLRNDFKAAMDKIDQDYLDELVNKQGTSGSKEASDVKVKGEFVELEKILAMAENLGKGNTDRDAEIIVVYLRHLQHLWARDLNAREHHLKISLQGKLETARFHQTVEYVRPLFRSLRNKKIDEEILDCLNEIIAAMLETDYVKANDHYLQMAIGNAPWPIGVTMVGIHARTGREKIFSRHVAHVLNDETQRKYIQGLKRLMTYAQKAYPTDPSKSVEYNGLKL